VTNLEQLLQKLVLFILLNFFRHKLHIERFIFMLSNLNVKESIIIIIKYYCYITKNDSNLSFSINDNIKRKSFKVFKRG